MVCTWRSSSPSSLLLSHLCIPWLLTLKQSGIEGTDTYQCKAMEEQPSHPDAASHPVPKFTDLQTGIRNQEIKPRTGLGKARFLFSPLEPTSDPWCQVCDINQTQSLGPACGKHRTKPSGTYPYL